MWHNGWNNSLKADISKMEENWNRKLWGIMGNLPKDSG